jgi:Domain of unknown function (DUF4055)
VTYRVRPMADLENLYTGKQADKPPTNDPSLPSYECAEYLSAIAAVTVCKEVHAGDLNMIDRPERYLPRNTNEGGAYKGRLIRTVFQNVTAPIINSYAGTLSLVEYADVPDTIMQYEQDIDLEGNSLSSFFDMVDVAAMRDGRHYVMVDFWSKDVDDRASEVLNKPRPFLRSIDQCQIINWRLEKGRLEAATIVEYHEHKSAYGSELEKVYRVINGADWRVVRLIRSKVDRDKWLEQIVMDDDGQEMIGQYLDSKGQPLDCCPIVIYKITGCGCAHPYFYDLAKLNIRLYQSQSDYWELLHKCNWPVPCFATNKSVQQADGSISLGPNDALMLGENGTAFYLQPNGESANASHEAIKEIQHSIDRYAITSVIGGQGKARTATEIRMLFSTIQKQLLRFAEQKESALTSVIEMMGIYLGLDNKSVGSIEIAADISALLTDETSIIALYGAGLLSLESAVQRLCQLGYHPDAAEEIILLKATEEAQQAKLIESLSQPTDYQSAGS